MALKVGQGASAPPFLVMDVIAAANARAASLPAGAFGDPHGVIRMEVGQPGSAAPRGAVEAAVRALTAGAPLGMEPVLLECGPATRFQPTVAMLDALDPRPDGLVVASPCNPAGTMLTPGELAAIARWCQANGVRLVSDEIYHGLSWGTVEESTAAAFSASAVVVNSFSKYWCMTGWRIGWLLLPEDLVRPVECLAQNLFISAPHVAQVAAEAAMDCAEELEAKKAAYARARAALLDGLPRAGLDRIAAADGAFYLWCDVAHLTNDSAEFCARMLEGAGIAATPGVDFDRTRGARFLRFSYCGEEAAMAAAPARLARWLAPPG